MKLSVMEGTARERRRWRRGALLGMTLLMVLGVTAYETASAAQQGTAGVRYEGELRIGSRSAPAGTAVSVIAPRSASDFTLCGSATVGSGGRYRLDVPATPGCIARTVDERRTLHVFVVYGENVGFASNGASLDEARSLGRTVRQDLRGTEIVAFDPALAPTDGVMAGVRYHGRLLLGGTPAPIGPVVSVSATRDGETMDGCGRATVTDQDGFYWLDVTAIRGCIAVTVEERGIRHIFRVDGATVGFEPNGSSLDQPRSLGHARRHDLRGAAPQDP